MNLMYGVPKNYGLRILFIITFIFTNANCIVASGK
jgi:hypothetical protein